VKERGWTAERVVGCEVHTVADEAGVVYEIADMESASVVLSFSSTTY
jgi:hypothetical protein